MIPFFQPSFKFSSSRPDIPLVNNFPGPSTSKVDAPYPCGATYTQLRGAADNLEGALLKYISTVIRPKLGNRPAACKLVTRLLLQGLGSLFLEIENISVHIGL